MPFALCITSPFSPGDSVIGMASLTRFPHQLVSSLLATIYLWPTSRSHLGSTKDFYVSPQLRNFPWLVLTGAIKLLDLPFKVVTSPLRALSLSMFHHRSLKLVQTYSPVMLTSNGKFLISLCHVPFQFFILPSLQRKFWKESLLTAQSWRSGSKGFIHLWLGRACFSWKETHRCAELCFVGVDNVNYRQYLSIITSY